MNPWTMRHLCPPDIWPTFLSQACVICGRRALPDFMVCREVTCLCDWLLALGWTDGD